MALWEIEPVADWDDPNWQSRPQWERVVVRADTPAFARAVARVLDTTAGSREFGDEHPRLGSGFANEKLYRVKPLADPGGFAEAGPDEILSQTRRLVPFGG